MTYLLTISFIGTDYAGWQKQLNAVSVQQVLFSNVSALFGSIEEFHGCSRTDSGVHANCYCVSFRAKKCIDPEKVPFALNYTLPKSISVLNTKIVPDGFHARYDCKCKEYLYRIVTGPHLTAFQNGFVWHRPLVYSLDTLNDAASVFVGRHDFSSFCAAGSTVSDMVRTVDYAYFDVKENNELHFFVRGDGFLYHQVRIMVGTLLSLSNGNAAATIKEILEKKDRNLSGPTAPAEGLYLNRVFYDN